METLLKGRRFPGFVFSHGQNIIGDQKKTRISLDLRHRLDAWKYTHGGVCIYLCFVWLKQHQHETWDILPQKNAIWVKFLIQEANSIQEIASEESIEG